MAAACLLGLWSLGGLTADAADWPQWRGPRRDGISTETGLLKQWPKEGPKLLWSVTGIGAGFSSASIDKGRIYITGRVEKQEKLSVFDLSGKLQWEKIYGNTTRRSFPDTRTTPTVRDGSVYVISGAGEVVCLDAARGTVTWSVDGFGQFAGKHGSWGTAESPLLVDDKVIYTPAGSKTTVVALDRRTGNTIWISKSLGDQSAYVSPILVPIGGRKQVVAVTGNYILGVNAADGAIDWQIRYGDIGATEDGADINANTPLFHDGRIYVTSGYNHTGLMLQLARDGRGATVAWVDPTLDTHHGHVVLVGGHLYGSNWINNRKGNWVAVDWRTGKPSYETEWFTKGSVISAEGKLYCYEERQGHLALVKADPRGFSVVSSFQITQGQGPHWAHPTISDGRLYVRHGDVLMAYDIKAPAAASK